MNQFLRLLDHGDNVERVESNRILGQMYMHMYYLSNGVRVECGKVNVMHSVVDLVSLPTDS